MLIEARSNVGPIVFGATGLHGYVDARISGAVVAAEPPPSGHVEIELDSLRSGNTLYDAELLRRIDARMHPVTVLELTEATRIGQSKRYQLSGELTFHGITRTIVGSVSASVSGGTQLQVMGEHVFDIRDFDIAAPSVLMLRIYPDVRVQLQLEAEVASGTPTDEEVAS